MLNLKESEKSENYGCKLIFAGTRPEIIKLAPLYKQLIDRGHKTLFCATFQHSNLTGQTLDFFKINPEIKLDVSSPGQTLCQLSSKLLDQTGKIIEKLKPSCVIVQGDTMTVVCAAMSAFLHKIPVLHVEAGLRTGNLTSPFPEEANRKICTMLTDLHFAPHSGAVKNLASEGCDQNRIFLVGNTIVDSLKIVLSELSNEKYLIDQELKSTIDRLKANYKKLAIMTVHRRESLGSELLNLAASFSKFIEKHGPDSLAIIYPRHPNPALDDFCNFLKNNLSKNIAFMPPLGYPEFIYALKETDFVITDSGGVFEEASTLGKPTICVRNNIERPENLQLDNVILTGFDQELINQALENCYSIKCEKTAQSNDLFNTYGQGDASKKIVEIIEQHFPKEAEDALSIKPATLDKNIKFCEKKPISVAVFGLGYVGLPTATVLARTGFCVTGIDTNLARLNKIKAGEIEFLEGALCDELKNQIQKNTLTLLQTLDKPVDFFIICVPTPLLNGKADLSYVFQCAESISKNLKPGALIILESTVPVGTTEQLEAKISSLSGLQANKDFFVAYCPERVLPGRMEQEIIENDRVIGAECPQAFLFANKLYKSFCTGNLSFVDFKSAELIKLVENSFRNVQVALANEVCDIAHELGLNATQIKEIANRHPRVNILNPGPGVGGHCVAVDPLFLEAGLSGEYAVLSSAIEANRARPEKIIKQILKKAEYKNLTNTDKFRVLIFGLTYKPNVPDLRESPALEIALKLNNFPNIEVSVFDPHVEKSIIEALGIKSLDQKEIIEEIKNIDLIAILVAHTSFKELFSTMQIDRLKILDSVCLMETIKREGKLQQILVSKKDFATQ